MSLFTIGHSTHTQEYFLGLLKQHNIDYVLDVRSSPFSKFASWFNKDAIEDYLKKNNIVYCPMGKFFGARPTDRTLYCAEGYLDFERTRASELFKKGLDNVMLGLASGHNIALMCTEKDPFDCHRTIMVSRGFELNGVSVQHIHADGNLETQDEINIRLLDNLEKKENVDIHQISLFEQPKSDKEWLEDAYRLRNKEIGYNINEGDQL